MYGQERWQWTWGIPGEEVTTELCEEGHKEPRNLQGFLNLPLGGGVGVGWSSQGRLPERGDIFKS